MLVFAAIGVFGAGMLAIAAGIPIKEFGFGNTLILSGVLAWCTSAIMVTLWVCFRDLRQAVAQPGRPARESEAPPAAIRPALPEPPASPLGWPETIPERAPAAPAPPPAEPPAPRRNLLFASNRKSRETPAAAESPIAPAPTTGPLEQRPMPAPDETRAVPRRIESPPPRTVRPVSTINPRDPVVAPPPPPPAAPAPPPQAADPIPPRTPPAPPSSRDADPASANRNAPVRSDAAGAVTVLKSGVVDGMAYWLYSDGSIEAQMPEGMMRFTSIDELRAHLDRRP